MLGVTSKHELQIVGDKIIFHPTKVKWTRILYNVC